MTQSGIIVRQLGRTDFAQICFAMQQFTAQRSPQTADEIWLTEHDAVYSVGLNRKNVRMPSRDDIAVVNCDRGGKITYHGPGQVIMYVLLDLKRYQLNIKQLVQLLENTVISILASHGIHAASKHDAPGVYVNAAKIAALGLRLKKDYCYHGLSLNVAMDLTPFSFIDPCGYAGLQVTQTQQLGMTDNVETIENQLVAKFQAQLLAHKAKMHSI